MNKFKALLIMGVVGALFATLAVTAFAAKPSTTDLSANSWKVYNGQPAANSFWNINKAQSVIGGGVTFPIQQFVDTSHGSFAIYLLTNYNVDLTGKTITAAVNWTAGTYETRSTVFPGAYVRLEFQDVTAGPFTSSDYWWYSGNLDLNAVTSGTLTASLTNRANWTNICGQSAADVTVYPAQPNCVGGTDPAGSPYDGFTHAMKNVKQVGLSFGSSGSYASGVALDGRQGTFNMTSFTVAP